MAEYLRIRQPGKHALLNPETGLHESPRPEAEFTADHPLVRAHPWAFGTDEDIRAEQDAAQAVTSVPIEPVEQATRTPGERRVTRRKPA